MATKNDKLYMCWCNMKSRCGNMNHRDYRHYGGRGIKVCLKWMTFEGFKKDMGDNYKQGLSIERIDNNKGYSKENCKWATQKEQVNNTRRNKFIYHDGMRKTISQWAEWSGVKSSTFRQRFYTYRWDFSKCLVRR